MAVARLITLLGNAGDPIEVTVATGTAIPKGTLMKWSATNLCAAATAANDFFAGIAAAEKTATDGVTRVTLLTHGIFDMDTKAGGSMTLGKTVKVDGANTLDVADDDTVLNCTEVVGVAMETVGAAAAGAVLVNV